MNKETISNDHGIFENGVHFGPSIVIDAREGNGGKDEIDIESLYSTKPRLGIIGRWIAAIISLIADVIAIFTGLNPLHDRTMNQIAAIFIDAALNEVSTEYIGVMIWLILLSILLLVTVLLLLDVVTLHRDSRYGSLRRNGKYVFSVIPGKCPRCNAKLKLMYDRGNYLECTQNPREHRWPVFFRQE